MVYDYDYIVIGSGFGGSVSALRLTEKGYSVGVMEKGKRFQPGDFPESNLQLGKYLWMPRLRLHGILQITWLKHLMVLHGAGVGGGSLVYAMTHPVPPDVVFRDPRWPSDEDWKAKLKPHYELAQYMLGTVKAPRVYAEEEMLRQVIDEESGAGPTIERHDVAAFFGEPGETVPDPFFGGEGPERTGCTECGACMSGCRYGAKNSLDHNYLHMAENRGCEVHPETEVTNVRPIHEGGYEVHTRSSTALFRKQHRIFRSRAVVFSASVLGTVQLMLQCKARGSLSNLSDQLGNYVRTNSEALLGVRSRDPAADHGRGIAITAGAHPDKNTHVEVVRFGKRQDFFALMYTLLTGAGEPWPRWARWLGNTVCHPIEFLRTCRLRGFGQRSVGVAFMQTLDNYLKLRLRRRRWGSRLETQLLDGQAVPTYMPLANEIVRRLADKMNGTPESMLLEVLGDTSSTGHILGGATMGRTPADGVCDEFGRVYGYENMYVCDGSLVPANLGVNPSLTITALSEYVMHHVPAKEGADRRPAPRPQSR